MRSPGAISGAVKLTDVPGRILNTGAVRRDRGPAWKRKSVERLRPCCEDRDEDP